MKRRTTLILFLSCFLFCPLILLAQQMQVTGKVTSKTDGSPLPGVTVIVQDTKLGTSTDMSGNFKISVPGPGTVLVFSQIGMQSQSVIVRSNSAPLNVVLTESSSALEEVVVVGYGTQKKSVVTGAITSVKASALESMPVNRIEQSLQGRTSGLTIAASSGQPGEAATVRLRGITSFRDGASNPLWVVDGIVVDNGGISYLNQSDIESIEVLKDAASQAIYGTRAAAGVILVTTKKGKSGSIQLNYNGYYGTSAPARKLSLLNATQYATLRNEAFAVEQSHAGQAVPFADPSSYGEGTDWQAAIFNNDARRQNHEFDISGGGEKSTFYSSFGYLNQEGIVATDISKYKRVNIRLNSTHKPTKWLTIGQNLGYAHNKSIGLGNTNSEFGGPLSSALHLDPITPLVETDPVKAAAYNTNARKDPNGYPYGISNYVGQEMTNPLAYISTRLGNYSWGDNFIGNVYAEVEPIKNLKVRSSFGGKLAFWGTESFTPQFYLNSSNINTTTQFFRESNNRVDWNVSNTVSYTKIFDKHTFTGLVGQEAYEENNTRMNNTRYDGIPVDNFEDASFNYGVPATQRTTNASEGQLHTVASLFARLNYNYDEKYLLEAVVRRDGSTRFGSNYRYGVFPSFGLGWVPTKESFWPENNIVNLLKIRGSYGVVGNDNIGDFAFVSTIGSGRNYAIGNSGSYYNGFSPNAPANPDLHWEETKSANIGFEAVLLNDFNFTFDWYKKRTTGILQNPRIPAYVGAISNPANNIADMNNSGLEFELGWHKKLNEVNLGLNGNFSYLKNEIISLEKGISYYDGDVSFQNMSYRVTRTAIGHPYNAFYGFVTQGIFQTQDEIENYVGPNGKIQPNAKPGDFRWKDIDGDGAITDQDRSFIGNPMPKYTFGLTANVNWKDFDLVVFGQGVAGNKIFSGLRRFSITEANWQTEALGRWTGPGTSNIYPRLNESDPNNNFKNPSDFYLKDGSYFRIKTLQIGYSIPKSVISKAGLSRVRVYIMSENLLTFTKYTGYDPEIGGGVLSIDRGVYPQARSFFLGLNVGL